MTDNEEPSYIEDNLEEIKYILDAVPDLPPHRKLYAINRALNLLTDVRDYTYSSLCKTAYDLH